MVCHRATPAASSWRTPPPRRAHQSAPQEVPARARGAAARSVPLNDEYATGTLSGPVAETFPVAEFVRALVAIGVGDRDRDGSDWVVLIGGLSAVEAHTIRLVIPLHILALIRGQIFV